MGACDELITYIRARYTLIYLTSFEEERVLADLERIAASEKRRLVTWSHARGARGEGVREGTGRGDPLAILDAIGTLPENALVALLDFHPFLSDAGVVRLLRELGRELEATSRTLVFLSPVMRLPTELSKDMVVVDFALPEPALLDRTLGEIASALPAQVTVRLPEAERERLVRSAQGLTLREFSNVIAKAIVTNGRLDRAAIETVNAEKRQVIRKSGILDYYPVSESLGSVGGLEHLKAWLVSRAGALGERARAFGLPFPKGVLIVGVQGCGKSLTAKAVADTFRLPLLKLDMGRLFGSQVGASEENMRHAIALAEAIAPAVLWIDEVEKGLSGLGSSNISDGGTTARVVGTFLTWMQEKTRPVFVVATANDVGALPPELLRKGRFDEIFFVDLPVPAERRAILEIHVARRGRKPADLDLDRLARESEGFSGAEIEGAVVSGLFRAFERGRDLATDDIMAALAETVPLSVLMKEKIEKFREWAKLRTRPASAVAVGVVG